MDFARQILNWYDSNRRDLPWRHTKDPYKIWMSEVILQQTRVDQGRSYYLKFANKYPNIQELAKASEQEVLKLWQGLGYYSRARNLLLAAKQVMNDYEGVFPNSYHEIISLRGVGEYTASAIASIAFGESVAVVDGNVKRVISRLLGLQLYGTILQRKVKQYMIDHLDQSRPGDFNQAVMEFGALHCIPKNPLCSTCIFKSDCVANQNGMENDLPVSKPKTKSRKRYFSYLVVFSESHDIIMQQRSKPDIWRNLYEFPLLESDTEINPEQIVQHPQFKYWFGENAMITDSTSFYKHQLTHQMIIARFHFVISDHIESILKNQKWERISHKDMNKYPVSRLIERFLQDHQSRIPL